MTIRVCQIGNFEPPYSTENDLYTTMANMDVSVSWVQESDVGGWETILTDIVWGDVYDIIIWTRTASLSEQVPAELRRRVQIQARLSGVPTVGIHLDRWWGLDRQADLYNDPFFRCEYLFTADGHDPARWDALGANHHWMPPAIAPHNAYRGNPQPEYTSDIAFVGGWQGYGHTEWTHRTELVRFLWDNYGGRVTFWPKPGEHAIRGAALNDLYASVKVVVGDSCLVPDPITGEPWTNYCSDRVFETIGRGAFLIHPYVDGVISFGPESPGLLDAVSPTSAEGDLAGWHLGNWSELRECIDFFFAHNEERQRVAHAGFEHVRAHHTYRQRLQTIFDTVLGES